MSLTRTHRAGGGAGSHYWTGRYCTGLYLIFFVGLFPLGYFPSLLFTVLYFMVIPCTSLCLTLLLCTSRLFTKNAPYWTVLNCIYCTLLYFTLFTILHCSLMYCTVNNCNSLCYPFLHCKTSNYTTLHHCTALQQCTKALLSP